VVSDAPGFCYAARVQDQQKIIVAWMSDVIARTGHSPQSWSKAAGVASTTITRAMKPDYKFVTKQQTLEALADAVGLSPPVIVGGRIVLPPNADVLVVLPNAILPKSQRGTRDADLSIRALAEALEYGLGLVARNPAIRSNPDALALAAQATADRLEPPRSGSSFAS
jgi:lambda repressor-like predicted transcriptional regulator